MEGSPRLYHTMPVYIVRTDASGGWCSHTNVLRSDVRIRVHVHGAHVCVGALARSCWIKLIALSKSCCPRSASSTMTPQLHTSLR